MTSNRIRYRKKIFWAFVTLTLLLFSLSDLCAQHGDDATKVSSGLQNGSVESILDSGQPANWGLPQVLKQNGYKLAVDADDAVDSKHSLLLDSTEVNLSANPNLFGNVLQTFDATPFQGKRVKFRAAVKTSERSNDGRAQLWLRANLAGDSYRVGAFDNMQNRPIRSDEWQHYEIVADIDDDAENIVLGMMVMGNAKAWLDDATFEIVEEDIEATAGNLRSNADTRFNSSNQPPSPFFVPWLGLVPIAFILFILANTRSTNLRWAHRFGLRFSILYWVLYSLPLPIYRQAMKVAARWTAHNVLGIQKALAGQNESGDTTAAYVRVLICFVAAVLAATLWSIIDRRSSDCARSRDLLRSYLRYTLTMTMLGYGFAKLGFLSNQFPAPSINRLTQSYGDSSPMGLLWTFMGASRSYTFFAGIGEVIGGLLLISRRTTTLGATVIFGVMLNVVMVNFCYDVPVKQFSFHLLAMATFLLLPECNRLINFFVLNRGTSRVELTPPYVDPASPAAVWTHRILKTLLTILVVFAPLAGVAIREFTAHGKLVSEPEYYGSYSIEEFTLKGDPVPPLLTDSTRWRMITIRRLPYSSGSGVADRISIKMMDDSTATGMVRLLDDSTWEISSQSPFVPQELSIEFDHEHILKLSGETEGKKLVAKLERVEESDFLLMNRGFHWINEFPYNR